MNPLDYLTVRFHYRGTFDWVRGESVYRGGRSGYSTLLQSKISVDELKKNLADHVNISEQVMEKTDLCWFIPDGRNKRVLVNLFDKRSVMSLAKYAATAGEVDVYAKIPALPNSEETFEQIEEPTAEQQQEKEAQFPIEEMNESIAWEQEEKEAHLPSEERKESSAQQPSSAATKLPFVRAPMLEKGKGPQIHEPTVQQSFDSDGSSDEDYLCAHEADDNNSSADDEEATMYREQAAELRKQVKRNMLGEEKFKECNVPESFVVPETVKLEEENEEACYDSEDELSYDEDNDGELKTTKSKHRHYDETAEVQEFELGQAFTNSRQFKQAILNYGLKNHHHLIFPKDERMRVSAKCSAPACNWSIYGSITTKSPWLKVASINNKHTCAPTRENKLVTSTVIAEKYFREIKDNPGWRIEKMQEAVLEDLCSDVSASKCKRAKRIVMERIIDSTNGEFSRVFDYHLELVRSNPGSTVAVTLNPDITDRPVFQRMYVCLDGCKKGFLAGCRRIIGLDGCFLKGTVTGQLLCAVGRDANNQMYPVAWASVENESYDSWYWFLSLLQKDIQINNHGEGWVIISDQQKGLIKAVNEIIPEAEHRMCARHIYANWRKQHREKLFQKMFWACAKSSDRIQFNYNRAKLALKTPEGARDMMKTAPSHWCRAYFRLGNYCDSVENNLCESFNHAILRARFYPIITSMEIIRRKVTARIAENRVKSQGWTGTICPNIFKKLKLNIKRSNVCRVLYNGKEGFEVEEGTHRRFTVNLDNMTCSCRYWYLSGLPCCHAIRAIYSVRREVHNFIAPCYRIDVYDQIYNHVLEPVEGKENWPVASNPKPFPPIKIGMPGRPKTERRREEGEKPKGNKLSRKATKMSCSMCGGGNHNKRKCTANPDVVKEHAQQAKTVKRKRKKQEKNTQQEAQGHTQQAQAQERAHAQPERAHVQPEQAAGKHPQVQVPFQATVPVAPKRYKKKATGAEGSSSQPTQPSQASTGVQFSRRQQIPMSQVVAEPVPKKGRMNWYLTAGKGAQASDAGQDGDGAQ